MKNDFSSERLMFSPAHISFTPCRISNWDCSVALFSRSQSSVSYLKSCTRFSCERLTLSYTWDLERTICSVCFLCDNIALIDDFMFLGTCRGLGVPFPSDELKALEESWRCETESLHQQFNQRSDELHISNSSQMDKLTGARRTTPDHRWILTYTHTTAPES